MLKLQTRATNQMRPQTSNEGEGHEGGSFTETLRAARAGDKQAQEDLLRTYYPQVERMVHRSLSRDMRSSRPWLRARFSTGDVVQEVFRSLLADLDGFAGEGEKAFVGYLAMVARNRIIDAIRFHEAAQRDGRSTRPTPEHDPSRSEQQGPATQVASNEELARFHTMMGTLPEREQLLLRARLEQGLRFQDLADQLGYSSPHSARRAFYAAQAQLLILLRQDESR
jgi:RNA polymerase sigma factor (sigma-70 family)